MVPVILYLPPTTNDTSVPPRAERVVALLAMAAFTNPCGRAQSASMRSSCAPGCGAAAPPPAGALGAGAGRFHA